MPDTPARSKPFRLGVFADGEVGLRTVEFVLRHSPDDLTLLIVNDGPAGRSLALGLGAAVPAQTRVMTWDEATTDRAIAEIKSLNLDVTMLAWWPHILPDRMLTLARRTTLNMHPSLLPHCRGKDPNFWTIVERRPFGVTLHHVTAGIDAGDIAFASTIPYGWDDTGASLYERAQREIVALFADHYEEIAEGDIPGISQPKETGSFHTRSQLEPASAIDLDAPTTARDLLDLLRARTFAPHPACRFEDQGGRFEVRVSVTRLDENG